MPKPKQQLYAKNPREMARWFFPDDVKKPRIFARQIKVCLGWTKDTSFPQKTAKGWLLAEVQQWNTDRYSKAQAKVADEMEQTGQLPGIPVSDAADLKKVLDMYQDKFFNPERYPEDEIKQWQVNFLKQHRPVLFSKEVGSAIESVATPETFERGKFPKTVRSLKQLCSIYHANWPELNLGVRPQDINNWQNGQSCGSTDPSKWHPRVIPGSANDYDVAACLEFMDREIIPLRRSKIAQQTLANSDGKQLPIDYRSDIERFDWNIRRIESENKERAHSDKWIEMEDARMVFSAGIIALRDEFRALVERSLPLQWEQRAKQSGWSDEQVRMVKGWALEFGIEAVNRVDDFCERQAAAANRDARHKVNERLAEAA